MYLIEGTTKPKIRQNILDAELDAKTKEEDLRSKIDKAYGHEAYLNQLVTDNIIKTVAQLKYKKSCNTTTKIRIPNQLCCYTRAISDFCCRMNITIIM